MVRRNKWTKQNIRVQKETNPVNAEIGKILRRCEESCIANKVVAISPGCNALATSILLANSNTGVVLSWSLSQTAATKI